MRHGCQAIFKGENAWSKVRAKGTAGNAEICRLRGVQLGIF